MRGLLVSVCLSIAIAAPGYGQTPGPRPLITGPIDESRLVILAGNTRPEAIPGNDLGLADDDLHLDMFLQLRRSAEQELAARQFVESLTDRTSPNFHKWISAAEYGRRFGVAAEDIAAVSGWLESAGFKVNGVPSNNMTIDFSGTAGQIRTALHTEIHSLNVGGRRYFANMSDPRIPEALLPAVTGVVSMSNIMPRPTLVPKSSYTVSQNQLLVVPGDLATIYNLNPAFAAGYTGLGQTVMVVEDTDLYSGTTDWNTFRQTFGLTQYGSASLTQVHPAGKGSNACLDPGINGDDGEAGLDVEWASAAAPNAAIMMASCSDTTNFGGFIALQNVLTNGGPLPSVVSISYETPEVNEGAAGNSFINTLYQTAAAVGVSVFVASGDEAAVGEDRGSEVALHGVTVSAFASTPYNVAVGGTDFGDTAAGDTASYWASANGTWYNSALSYVPEIPWNDSCASEVLANYKGFSAAYGSSGFCNSIFTNLTVTGGGGGPSGCVTGSPQISGVVDGKCGGYAKPSWQAIAGNPNDGVRDIPDVALFAANGMWNHYYVFCLGCSGPPSTWDGAGGTSFASPIMAGMQTLINQALGQNNVGNPNPVYYQIAQNEYANSSGLSGCNSTSGPASTCAFNDVTQGDITAPCAGIYDCFLDGGGIGVLSTSDTAYQPAYAATPGWDFATGIGTVNAFNLIEAYVDSIASPTAPAVPTLVSPSNGATGIGPSLLTWNAAQGARSYDVYFGAASPPPLVANTTSLNYTLGPLDPSATYNWAIGARNTVGASVSSVWSFTTGCVAGFSPSSVTAIAAGTSGTIPVTATSGCAWTATSNVTWISITSGSSGTGNGSVSYNVAPNTGALRTGTITVGVQTFTIVQGSSVPLISTLTGGGMPATTSPGAQLSIAPGVGIAADAAGNVYFASPDLNAVFKSDSAGTVVRIAGTGVPGFHGDGGPALSAQLNAPSGVAVDAAGNIYIADSSNYRIRRIDPAGNIATVAGAGQCCSASGDGGPATSAVIGFPQNVAVDSKGNLYLSDDSNYVVRMVTSSGTIGTVAGNGTYGFTGDGGPATKAELRYPLGLQVDSAGNLYIADTDNGRVRKVNPSGVITTIAGGGSCCNLGDGGPATSAYLSEPEGIALDGGGNIYVTDPGSSRVREIGASGTITTVAGDGASGYSGDGAAATNSELDEPQGVAVDASGNLYIGEYTSARIRKVAAGTGAVMSTLVGGATNDGEPAVFGLLNQPFGVAQDGNGNTYIADTDNNRIREVTAGGTITTFAGTGMAGFAGDGGAATAALLNAPRGLAVDGAGNVYVADSLNNRIRKVDTSGNISTLAGNAIGEPYGLAIDSSGNLFVSDIENDVIRKISPSGAIVTVAGSYSYGYSGDGGPATSAQLREPYGVAVDPAGNLYIADTFSSRVRKVNTSGVISTIAGGVCCNLGDGGPATSAYLSEPQGIAVDGSGNVYVSDTDNLRVRWIDPAGTITTLAGTNAGYSGDGGAATGAQLRYPTGLFQGIGNIYVADSGNNAVRVLTPTFSSPVLSVGSMHSGPFYAGQGAANYTVTVANAAGAAATSGFTLQNPTLPRLQAAAAGAAATSGQVTVTEALPAGLTLLAMGGTGWTCSAPSSPVCMRSDSLAAGTSFPSLTVTVSVSGTAPGQLTNQVAVAAGAVAAGAEDLTAISSAPPGGPIPAITPGGVVPVFSSSTTVEAGEWASIYGTNLASTSATWNGDFPTILGGSSVKIGGEPAYLSFASPGLINVQVPAGLSGATSVVVTTANGSAASTVTVAQYAPTFFLLDATHVAAIILRSDDSGAYGNGTYDIVGPTGSSLGYPTVAAKAGDSLVLFGTGFGPTTPSVPPGPFTGSAATVSPVTLSIGGVACPTTFTGLSAPGTYQINLTVPSGLGSGDVALRASVNGIQTPPNVVVSLR